MTIGFLLLSALGSFLLGVQVGRRLARSQPPRITLYSHNRTGTDIRRHLFTGRGR